MPETKPPAVPSPSDDPRVYLAAERTLLAWIRTGLALMGFGFVVARFGLIVRELAFSSGDLPPPRSDLSQWAGIALIIIGALVNILATAQHVSFLRKVAQNRPTRPSPISLGTILSVILAMLGLLLAGYLLIDG